MTKRILSVVLVLTMIFSLGAVSFTADAATTKSYSMTTQSTMISASVTKSTYLIPYLGASYRTETLKSGRGVWVYEGSYRNGYYKVLTGNGNVGYCKADCLRFTWTYLY